MAAKMTDVLIRDVPDEVIAALDAHAARLGLSGASTCAAAWLKTPPRQVPRSACNLARFASTFADLADPDVMSRAWT